MAYANSVDLLGAVWSRSTLFAISTCILGNYCIKSKIWAKKVWSKMFKILGNLPSQHLIYSDRNVWAKTASSLIRVCIIWQTFEARLCLSTLVSWSNALEKCMPFAAWGLTISQIGQNCQIIDWHLRLNTLLPVWWLSITQRLLTILER